MQIQPYKLDELKFAWCYRVYYRWRTHRRIEHQALANLDQETVSQLLTPYSIRLLELATDQIEVRALVSLQPTETVSVAASKMKGRVSKWLGEQQSQIRETKPLAHGYFASTAGQATADAVEQYLTRQGERHGYEQRARPPLFVRRFTRTAEDEKRLQTDHAFTVLRVHVVLATWGRRGVFLPNSAQAVCDAWRSMQSEWRVFVDKVSFLPDHVHVAIALHPSVPPAEVVPRMMDVSQVLMWERFDDAVIRAGIERLWQPSAYLGSFGELTSNAVSAYVRKWQQVI